MLQGGWSPTVLARVPPAGLRSPEGFVAPAWRGAAQAGSGRQRQALQEESQRALAGRLFRGQAPDTPL
eukprot:971560-Lingulodinium_polyedra.AAC.1